MLTPSVSPPFLLAVLGARDTSHIAVAMSRWQALAASSLFSPGPAAPQPPSPSPTASASPHPSLNEAIHASANMGPAAEQLLSVPYAWLTRLAGRVSELLAGAELDAPQPFKLDSPRPYSPSNHRDEQPGWGCGTVSGAQGQGQAGGHGTIRGAQGHERAAQAVEVSSLAGAALALRLPLPITARQALVARMLSTPALYTSRDLREWPLLFMACVLWH